jgi:hypothetical protein
MTVVMTVRLFCPTHLDVNWLLLTDLPSPPPSVEVVTEAVRRRFSCMAGGMPDIHVMAVMSMPQTVSWTRLIPADADAVDGGGGGGGGGRGGTAPGTGADAHTPGRRGDPLVDSSVSPVTHPHPRADAPAPTGHVTTGPVPRAVAGGRPWRSGRADRTRTRPAGRLGGAGPSLWIAERRPRMAGGAAVRREPARPVPLPAVLDASG